MPQNARLLRIIGGIIGEIWSVATDYRISMEQSSFSKIYNKTDPQATLALFSSEQLIYLASEVLDLQLSNFHQKAVCYCSRVHEDRRMEV